MSVPFLIQLNVVLQIATLGLVYLGFYVKTTGRWFRHGVLMFMAVVLNTFSFLVIMGPSLIAILSESLLFGQFSVTTSVLILFHEVIGLSTEGLGVWLVFTWRLNRSPKACIGRKKMMIITIVLWTASLAIGLALYLNLFPP